MNTVDDVEKIPPYMRCKVCKGRGVTESPETIIGSGMLLEAGKAYLNRNQLVCFQCQGSGIDPAEMAV